MGYIYNYKIVRTEKKLEDGIASGLIIEVVLDKVDDISGIVVKSTCMDWFAPTVSFINWPNQTSSDIKIYVENYLNEEVDGVTRKSRMRSVVDTVVITYQKDNTITDQDRVLNI